MSDAIRPACLYGFRCVEKAARDAQRAQFHYIPRAGREQKAARKGDAENGKACQDAVKKPQALNA
jgi:hypothetical protein